MQHGYVREPFPSNGANDLHQRLSTDGVETLRDGELLALILSMDVAETKERLAHQSTTSGLLAHSFDELAACFDQDKVDILICAIELAKRVLNKGLGIVPAISCPADTLPYLSSIKDRNKEHFLCLYLNARNQVIHQEIISVGSLSASIVHPREVFHIAVANPCASVILAHNHPSDDPRPSQDDIELSRRLAKAGEILGIEVLDHIIVTTNDFISFKEKGLLP